MKKEIITAALLTIINFSSLTIAGEANKKDCIEYEPSVVRLTGMLLEQVFPGRPEHASIHEGDERLTHWILHLKEPICVNGNDNDLVNEEAQGVCAIQLTHTSKRMPDMYERYEHLLSKEIVVIGTLFHGISAWHKTRVLIEVRDIKPGEAKNEDFNNCSENVAAIPTGQNEANAGMIVPKDKIQNKKSHDKYTKAESGKVNGERTILYSGPGMKEKLKTGGHSTWRNNNPGYLRCGKFARSHGAIGCDGVFAIFPDEKTGDSALKNVMRSGTYFPRTIEEFIEKWAPRPYLYSVSGANLKEELNHEERTLSE